MTGTLTKRLLITPGEPAGIGPDIVIQAAQIAWPTELVVIADPDLLQERAQQLGLPLKLRTCDLTMPPAPHEKGSLGIIPVMLKSPAEAGKLDPRNAAYVIETLEKASSICMAKKAHAIVTGPVQKSVINTAGIPFTGHTEFFAAQANVPHTIMLFVVDELKIALATVHLPLRQVPDAITATRLNTVFSIVNDGLKQLFGIAAPRILVAGLNPHAGESGYLGREEIDTIAPQISVCQTNGINIKGPYPPDTLFTPKHLAEADVVIAMYHDQALPLIKHIGFDRAVNVTLGLPFIRTSVDHGTALDIAGTKKADANSLLSAIKLAAALTPPLLSD